MVERLIPSDWECAVLGAGGFIGTNLCRRLVGHVKSVRAFGRRLSFPQAVRGTDWFPGDFNDPTTLAPVIAGCDVVFHLVGATTPASSNVDIIADLNANVISTLRLLDICRSEGPRIIFVSSGGTVYGRTEQVPTPEVAPTNPITAYGISKLAVEKYLGLYEHSYGLEYRVLRVANPFGPYQTVAKHQGVIAAFLERTLTGNNIEVWGDGSVIRDYIYVDDVVDALERSAVDQSQERIFNIGSGQGRSIKEIIRSVEEVLDFPISIQWREGRTLDVPKSILDISLARRELGWHPRTDFREALYNTLQWMRVFLRSGRRSACGA